MKGKEGEEEVQVLTREVKNDERGTCGVPGQKNGKGGVRFPEGLIRKEVGGEGKEGEGVPGTGQERDDGFDGGACLSRMMIAPGWALLDRLIDEVMRD